MRVIHRLLAGATLAALAIVARSGTPDSAQLLTDLRQGLMVARALPDGSRPPHPNRDMSPLLGLKRAELLRVLGAPSYCGHDESWSSTGTNCNGVSPWQYSWGPPAPDPQSAGPGFVLVTTGGPWLLVLEFSSDKVSAVHWQGQR